jgi:hypothetical protein
MFYQDLRLKGNSPLRPDLISCGEATGRMKGIALRTDFSDHSFHIEEQHDRGQAHLKSDGEDGSHEDPPPRS